MEVEYQYNISLYISLTDEQFELVNTAINECSETKYAATYGNFWYGNLNSRKFCTEKGDTPPKINCTYRQLDAVILKSLERMSYAGNEYQELYYKLFKVLKDCNAHCASLYENSKTLNYPRQMIIIPPIPIPTDEEFASIDSALIFPQ